MGLADALILLGLTYGSVEAVEFCENISKIMATEAVRMSNKLAKKYGAYPKCHNDNLALSYLINKLENEDITNNIKKYGLRNSQLLTIAPTGSISTMWNVSGGIEPLFAKKFTRTTKSLHDKDVTYDVFPKIVEKVMNEVGVTDISELPKYVVSSEDIDYYDRITMQSVFQDYIDASISSTINLPNSATVENVKNIYFYAWECGLKGVTIFRDGCARLAILNRDNSSKEEIPSDRQAPKRPKELKADYHQIKVKGEQFIVLVGKLDGKPYEVFTFRPKEPVNIPQHEGVITKLGKEKYSFDSEYLNVDNIVLAITDVEEKAATLNASLALRHGVKIKFITKTLKKVNDNITSFSSAMCRILNKYTEVEVVKGEVCPDCGGQIINEGGCIHCVECGWSKCS